jgi:hypothetical protein
MNIFLKRMTPPQEESQAGPSGRIPEEGIDIVGENSSSGTRYGGGSK